MISTLEPDLRFSLILQVATPLVAAGIPVDKAIAKAIQLIEATAEAAGWEKT